MPLSTSTSPKCLSRPTDSPSPHAGGKESVNGILPPTLPDSAPAVTVAAATLDDRKPDLSSLLLPLSLEFDAVLTAIQCATPATALKLTNPPSRPRSIRLIRQSLVQRLRFGAIRMSKPSRRPPLTISFPAPSRLQLLPFLPLHPKLPIFVGVPLRQSKLLSWSPLQDTRIVLLASPAVAKNNQCDASRKQPGCWAERCPANVSHHQQRPTSHHHLCLFFTECLERAFSGRAAREDFAYWEQIGDGMWARTKLL